MKTKSNIILQWLLAALFVLVMPVAVFAADTGTLTSDVPASVSPWYLSGALWGAVLALVAGGIAIWQNKEKKTAQKVSETLVLAIEQASKIPEVAEKEKALKAKIKEVTTKNGVEPIVSKLVHLLT